MVLDALILLTPVHKLNCLTDLILTAIQLNGRYFALESSKYLVISTETFLPPDIDNNLLKFPIIYKHCSTVTINT